MSEIRDTREQMAEIYANRDRIRAKIDATTEPAGSSEDIANLPPRTELDGNGDVIAAPRADGSGVPADFPFTVKDSGIREQYDSGMVRDTAEGKPDYTLILDGPMLDRWAEHMTKGAVKYEARNWMRAEGVAELERFRQSALRHLLQWLRGDIDEDHAAAVIFNINGAEYVKAREVPHA